MISYKTKYTQLLQQHLEVIGHLNAALTERSALITQLLQAAAENSHLSGQVEKLQAAAVKQIEKTITEKLPAKSK